MPRSFVEEVCKSHVAFLRKTSVWIMESLWICVENSCRMLPSLSPYGFCASRDFLFLEGHQEAFFFNCRHECTRWLENVKYLISKDLFINRIGTNPNTKKPFIWGLTGVVFISFFDPKAYEPIQIVQQKQYNSVVKS